MQENELKHYGVLGMKWGVRKGNVSRAYYKATKKADKLYKKAAKTELKAAKRQLKAAKRIKKASSHFVPASKVESKKAIKAQYDAAKTAKKAAKLKIKAMKWENAMRKEFANVKRSEINPKHLDAGRNYVNMLLNE